MQTITAYTIVTSGDENAFAKAIQELIKEGWQPYGQHSATLFWGRFSSAIFARGRGKLKTKKRHAVLT